MNDDSKLENDDLSEIRKKKCETCNENKLNNTRNNCKKMTRPERHVFFLVDGAKEKKTKALSEEHQSYQPAKKE